MSNRHEAVARRRKADAIEAALHERNRRRYEAHEPQITATDLGEWTDQQWLDLANEVGVNPPSEATRALILLDARYNQIRHISPDAIDRLTAAIKVQRLAGPRTADEYLAEARAITGKTYDGFFDRLREFSRDPRSPRELAEFIITIDRDDPFVGL
jgi:hypothetical protein